MTSVLPPCHHRSMRGVLVLVVLLVGCHVAHDADTGVPDAPRLDVAVTPDTGGAVCGCRAGPHVDHVYVLGDEGELYSFDPRTSAFEHVIAPVCAPLGTPYSMAVDPGGSLWILDAETRRIQRFDLLAPGPCTDSGYLPTRPELPLFGMGFSSPNADADCASLYVHSYSGEGPFAEGSGLGRVGVIERSASGALEARVLGTTDYDGAEMTGTGDGRLFAFGGVMPSKLVEIDPDDGTIVEVMPLPGLARTNASAFAFFGGDFYFFTEALPEGCDACLDETCAAAREACDADPECTEQLACAIERGRITDDCGGGVGPEMLDCLGECSGACLSSAGARVSRVSRLDWDRSDGPERTLTHLPGLAPIRIVGAGTSPCVPTTPF